jgi:predicted nucleic acid-binding protein
VLLVNTGPLAAAADTDDAHHQTCRILLEDDPGPLVTNALVIAEAAYLLDRADHRSLTRNTRLLTVRRARRVHF